MVQQFHARIITASRVLLEWRPPSRPGVTKYKVRTSTHIIHTTLSLSLSVSLSSSGKRLMRQDRKVQDRITRDGLDIEVWKSARVCDNVMHDEKSMTVVCHVYFAPGTWGDDKNCSERVCESVYSHILAEGPRDALVREILQLRNIPFEEYCNRQMTLKYVRPRSSQLLLLDGPYITSC